MIIIDTNNHTITNISEQLEAEFGKHGTPKRASFDDEAYAFYTSIILRDARKNARLTQAELAKILGCDKYYISRIEKGVTVPSVATFYRIVSSMGLAVELTPTSKELRMKNAY